MRRLVVVAWVALAACLQGPATDVRVGATTSVRDSGLLDVLVRSFEDATGLRAVAIVGGTGHILELGRRGDVDVLLTHSPRQEEEFLQSGQATNRTVVMTNRFLLVGPEADRAATRSTNATQALARIAEGRHLFASRGDASGTHDRELELWRLAGLDTSKFSPSWYKETGSGQAATLRYASERNAYALTDEATWAQLRTEGAVPGLATLVDGDAQLVNVYSVLLLRASRAPTEAERFRDWLAGPAGQTTIEAYEIGDERVFTPTRTPS